MLYNQTKTNGMPMPLLMGYTQVIPTEMIPEEKVTLLYDPIMQTVLDLGGAKNTRSARPVQGTSNGGRCSDMKAVNDDVKYL
ncbi:MAG: hypothetical protein IJT04_07960 [Bacteroidales bacterium]|nr:hypothetical protein [Bacteroidales bacterium]